MWAVCLLAALLFGLAGTIFTLRDAYRYGPEFYRVALNSQVEDDGSITVSSFDDAAAGGPIPLDTRILRIDGEPLARDARIWDVAASLQAAAGPLAKPSASGAQRGR